MNTFERIDSVKQGILLQQKLTQDLINAVATAIAGLDDMEKVNAVLGRDVMAATCLMISNGLRNALIQTTTDARSFSDNTP